MPSSALALAAALLLGASAQAQGPRQVRVAAAADLKWALEEVRTAFEQERPGTTLALTFGSSGNLHAQLLQKAPFDVFLSADLEYPKRLVEAGLAHGLFTYAIGHLVLWVPRASPLALDKLGLAAVKEPSVRKVSLANPRHAPYGRAAEAALRGAGLWEAVQGKAALGENVSQAAQFVETGSAEVGLIALSLALSPPMKPLGRFWAVPQDRYPRLEQGGVVLDWAQDREAARAFAAFLTGPRGAAILARSGFEPPP